MNTGKRFVSRCLFVTRSHDSAGNYDTFLLWKSMISASLVKKPRNLRGCSGVILFTEPDLNLWKKTWLTLCFRGEEISASFIRWALYVYAYLELLCKCTNGSHQKRSTLEEYLVILYSKSWNHVVKDCVISLRCRHV